MIVLLLLIAALGHAVLWAAAVNRLHGTSLRQKIRQPLSQTMLFLAAAVPIGVAIPLYRDWFARAVPRSTPWTNLAWGYVFVCAGVFVMAVLDWLRRRWHVERRGILLSHDVCRADARRKTSVPLTSPGIPTLLSRLPGNQMLEINVCEKGLAIPGLTTLHDGLRIAHLSDLHMSGRITKAYFEQVVGEVNNAQADLIAVTGDIVERAACLDWLPDTLGRLRARYGVYYVLGNHDRHVPFDRLTRALDAAGLCYLGGRWQKVTIGGGSVVLAGNELPWYAPAADMRDAPTRDGRRLPLRILLAHSPDQFRWAQEWGFDLMLAGHNHGGQICLPIVGPMVAPSLHGVRYAAGLFRGKNTVMHVCRGTSSLTPLRLNCPPEIAILTLRAAEVRG